MTCPFIDVYQEVIMKHLSAIFLTFFLIVSYAFAEEVKPIKPSPKDKCPVCGMFVAKYPKWVAEIVSCQP